MTAPCRFLLGTVLLLKPLEETLSLGELQEKFPMYNGTFEIGPCVYISIEGERCASYL